MRNDKKEVKVKRILWVDRDEELVGDYIELLKTEKENIEIIICKDLNDLDDYLNQEWDLVITGMVIYFMQTKSQKLPDIDSVRAGLDFVMPKLIKNNLKFIVFSGIVSEELMKEIKNFNNLGYLGYYQKIDFPPSKFFL